ncbi:3083_t:CDS:10, partial [Cetraspora pellucida]
MSSLEGVTLKGYGHTDKNDTAFLDAYRPEEIHSQYVIQIAGKGYTMIDYPSEVYKIPDTHEFACADTLYSTLDCMVSLNNFVLASSSNTEKYSWHIIYSHTQFINYQDLKGFVEKVIESVGEPYSKFIDIGLYKSHFNLWLLESAKEGFIAKYGWLQVGKIGNGFINFEAHSIKECPICKVKHDKNQLYRFIRKNGHFILKCYQQKQYKPDYKGLSFDKVSDKVESKEKSKEVINIEKLKDTPESYSNFLSTEKTATLIYLSPATWKATTLREIIMASNLSENVRVVDNKYQPRIGETVEILYDPNSGAEAMRIEYGFLKQRKCVAFVLTGAVMARALVERASKLTKSDNSPIKAYAYYGDIDRKQHQKDFSDINTAWGELDCIAYTNTVEAGIFFEVTSHFDIVISIMNIATLVHIEALAQMLYRIYRENFHAELAIIVAFIEVEHQKCLSARNFIKKFCSLIASTAKALDIKKTDFNAIATAQNLSSKEAEFFKLNQGCFVEDTIVLKHFYIWNLYGRKDMNICYKAEENFEDSVAKNLRKTYLANHWKAIQGLFQSLSFTDIDDKQILSDDQIKVAFEQSQISDLKSAIKAINAIVGNWCGYTIKSERKLPYNDRGFNNQEKVMAKKLDNPKYCSINPVLPSHCLAIEHKVSDLSSNVIDGKALSLEMSAHNQSAGLFQDRCYVDTKLERLEQWRIKIAFELQDNQNYWKKEHESIDEVTFL